MWEHLIPNIWTRVSHNHLSIRTFTILTFLCLTQLEDDMDMEDEIERELAAEQLEEEEEEMCLQMAMDQDDLHRPLAKVLSLPANFTFSESNSSSPNSEWCKSNLMHIRLENEDGWEIKSFILEELKRAQEKTWEIESIISDWCQIFCSRQAARLG